LLRALFAALPKLHAAQLENLQFERFDLNDLHDADPARTKLGDRDVPCRQGRVAAP
jgi:hypothetical protein